MAQKEVQMQKDKIDELKSQIKKLDSERQSLEQSDKVSKEKVTLFNLLAFLQIQDLLKQIAELKAECALYNHDLAQEESEKVKGLHLVITSLKEELAEIQDRLQKSEKTASWQQDRLDALNQEFRNEIEKSKSLDLELMELTNNHMQTKKELRKIQSKKMTNVILLFFSFSLLTTKVNQF